MSPKGYKYEPSGDVAETESKPEVREDVKPTVLLSNADAHIYDRLREQPKSLEDIKVVDRSPQDGGHALKLPAEVDKLFKSKGLTPRWIMKNPRSIDLALDVRKWSFANKVLFPELPKHLFTANGTIENGDLILMFMPEPQAKVLRELPGKISSEKMKSLPIEKWKDDERGEKYFKPTLSKEPDGEESSDARGIRSLQIEQ